MTKVVYTAYFVNEPKAVLDSIAFLLSDLKDKQTYCHHVTIAFKPAQGIAGLPVGETVPLNAIGYVKTSKLLAIIVEEQNFLVMYFRI